MILLCAVRCPEKNLPVLCCPCPTPPPPAGPLRRWGVKDHSHDAVGPGGPWPSHRCQSRARRASCLPSVRSWWGSLIGGLWFQIQIQIQIALPSQPQLPPPSNSLSQNVRSFRYNYGAKPVGRGYSLEVQSIPLTTYDLFIH